MWWRCGEYPKIGVGVSKVFVGKFKNDFSLSTQVISSEAGKGQSGGILWIGAVLVWISESKLCYFEGNYKNVIRVVR